MEKPIETIVNKKGNIRGEIFVDFEPNDPRGDDHIGTMVCFHKKYTLGDTTELLEGGFTGWADLEKYLVKHLKAIMVLPLYLYDHSGISIKVGSFAGSAPHASWDSEQVGFIYATKASIRKMCGTAKMPTALLKEALINEVREYDQCLTGDIYRYVIIKTLPACKSCGHVAEKVIDSCGGFYGLDAVRDAVKEELKCNQ